MPFEAATNMRISPDGIFTESQVQLLALLHPKNTSDMIQSLLADQ
jgi:hypothetical protein